MTTNWHLHAPRLSLNNQPNDFSYRKSGCGEKR